LLELARPAPISNSSSKHADGRSPRAERLVEAMKQQTATSGVLRIISSSPAEIQPVLTR